MVDECHVSRFYNTRIAGEACGTNLRKSMLRRHRQVLVLGIFMLSYVATYAVWSRIAFSNCRKFGMSKSFLYLPISSETPVAIERIVQIIFMPVNVLDQQIFGAPWPGGPLIDRELGSYRTLRKIDSNSLRLTSFQRCQKCELT